MAQAIQSWSNPLPGTIGVDLELIFESLTNWLATPTFLNGITVGNGSGVQTGDGAGVNTTVVNANSITQAPLDTSAPGTPSVTALGGIRSILAYWSSITTANGSPVAGYIAEVASDAAFTTLVQTLHPVGPVVSFDNLTANTTYYVRVAAVSYAAVQGSWSGTATVTTPQIAAGDIAANTITAGSAIIGSAAISAAQIASLSAGQITAGTINAQTIQLGATGGTAALQSTNYVAGTTGWAVLGDGTSQFASVNITGGIITLGPSGASYCTVAGSDHFASSSGLTLFFSGTTVGSVLYSSATSTVTVSGQVSGANAAPFLQFSSAGSVQLKGGGGQTQNFIQLSNAGGITLSPGTGAVLIGSHRAVQSLNTTGQPTIQAFEINISTNVNGKAVITFPTAFPSALDAVTVCLHGGAALYGVVSPSDPFTSTGFTIVIYNGTSLWASAGPVTLDVIAVGH